MLSARQRRVVEALGDTMFPRGREVLPGQVDAFFARLPQASRDQFGLALNLFDLGGVLYRGRPFHKLPPATRDRYLRGWTTSRLPMRRVIYRAIRSTLALLYFQDERTWSDVSYPGPPVAQERR